ncbi:unnamed protein product, partial [marine sediment metagenome]
SNHEKLTTVYDIPDPENQQSTGTILKEQINADGQLDEEWGVPLFSDSTTDAGGSITDLSNLYLKHNNTHLFIGFGFGAGEWKGDDVHFCVALDVKDGGTRQDPGLHPKVMWAGKNLPDHLVYLQTDSESIFSDKIVQGTLNTYNSSIDDWNSGVTITENNFAVSSELNFAELILPLSSIDLSSGGNFSIMIFSTEKGKPAAADSIPDDQYTDGSGNEDSWLTINTYLNLTIEDTGEV